MNQHLNRHSISQGFTDSEILTTMEEEDSLKELNTIPGVGKSISRDLLNIGIRRVSDLKGRDPEQLYVRSNRYAGVVQDRCLLYVFRCAVYFAETPEEDREQEKLQWWNWKDQKTADDKSRRQ